MTEKKPPASSHESSEPRMPDRFKDLFKALRCLKTEDEFKRFFDDLCTPQELRSLADRWRVARQIEAGHSYRHIYEHTGVSTATITRVGRSLTYGADGYRLVLKRLGTKGETNDD